MQLELTRLRVTNVDDPAVYAAEPLYEWLQTEQGRYCQKHFANLTYHLFTDVDGYGHVCVVTADVDPGVALTGYLLKWP
jgi:hypothetical protein